MSPTWIFPSATLCPPTHIINSAIEFIINIKAGIIKLIALFTNMFVFIKIWFALSNLFSSFFSVLNALITGKPVSISLDTKFNLSTNSCNFLNLGIAIINKSSIIPIMHKIANPIIHAIDVLLLFNTLINPPIPTIGAYTTTLNSIVIRFWICCISLVLRVIREAVEKFLNSSIENPKTFLNTLSLRFCPSLAATFDDKYIIIIAAVMLIKATPNICIPVINM